MNFESRSHASMQRFTIQDLFFVRRLVGLQKNVCQTNVFTIHFSGLSLVCITYTLDTGFTISDENESYREGPMKKILFNRITAVVLSATLLFPQ